LWQDQRPAVRPRSANDGGIGYEYTRTRGRRRARRPGGHAVGYQHLQNTLKAIALTVPAARAFEMTVEFVLGQGRDTPTVGRLEAQFRERPAMKTCIERLKAAPAARKCIDERYMGPELNLDELATYPRGSLGYTFAKIMKHLGYAAHFYTDRPSIDEETDYVT